MDPDRDRFAPLGFGSAGADVKAFVREDPLVAPDPSWTALVCQCIRQVPGIVVEFGLCGDLLAGEADADVLERAERPDDSADAQPGLVLHVAGDP